MSGRWVFWDFDGTLGFGPYGPGGWSPCLQEALDLLHPGHGLGLEEIRPGVRAGYPWQTPLVPHLELDTPGKWWGELESHFASWFGELGFEETAIDLAKTTRKFYSDGSRWGLYDDVLPALRLLRESGWRNAILSNHIPELEENLGGLGLSELINVVVSSGVIGYEKPHPEAYRIALEAVGNPESPWMVGDSYEPDVAGAARAGMNPILVRQDDDRALGEKSSHTSSETIGGSLHARDVAEAVELILRA